MIERKVEMAFANLGLIGQADVGHGCNAPSDSKTIT